MGLKRKAGLIAALLLVLAAVLTPLEYAPAALILLLFWAAYHRINLIVALAAMFIFSLMLGVSALILGFGAVHSVLTSLRAITILLPVYVYFSYSTMQEIMETLESFGVPRDFSFMFSITVPYAHVIGRKAKQVRIAQKSRGSSSPWAIIMPLLNFVFERAKMLAISIECRGWSAEEKA
jgi:energy-coupling factor transporter transmembrane protein EcfT